MALFVRGMPCPLCGEPMVEDQEYFSTWGVWLPKRDEHHRYCDATMHWDCYANWEGRSRFAQSYFRSWIKGEQENPYWHRVYEDELVFVEINPSEPVCSTWVHLAKTGSRHNVSIDEWEAWLMDYSDTHPHPLEQECMGEAKVVLRRELPSAEALVNSIDLSRKQQLFANIAEETARCAASEKARIEVVQRQNVRSAEVFRQIQKAGAECNHCGQHSTEFRLSTREGHRSLIICRNCGFVFDDT